MKSLIVDDEFVSRKKMEKIMQGVGECEAVESGGAALTAFEAAWQAWAPFDLILLDISMPEMGGTEVLRRIRERERHVPPQKRVKIIMVSAHKDKDSIIGCIQAGCDDYIMKPFDGKIVLAKLSRLNLPCPQATAPAPPGLVARQDPAGGEKTRIDTKDDLIEEIMERLNKREFALPAYPEVGLRFRQIAEHRADMDEVAEVLALDPAITAKLLAVANSAYYGGRESYKTLDEAINRLGLETTSNYVDIICTQAMLEKSDRRFDPFLKRLWEHSLACGFASHAMGEALHLKLGADSFLLGLLHDIGKLLLLEIISAIFHEEQHQSPVSDAILLEILDELHNTLGMTVLEQWGFSEVYLNVARDHNRLDKAKSVTQELMVVHGANALVHSMAYQLATPRDVVAELQAARTFLKLDGIHEEGIRNQTMERLQVAVGALSMQACPVTITIDLSGG